MFKKIIIMVIHIICCIRVCQTHVDPVRMPSFKRPKVVDAIMGTVPKFADNVKKPPKNLDYLNI